MDRSLNRHRSASPASRWTAVLCLLAFLAGGAGVLPSLFLVMAAWDGTHTPQVRSTASQFKLVLHHRVPGHSSPITEAGGLAAHRHGLAAKSLCLLATPSPLDPDHRLELAQSSPTERSGAAPRSRLRCTRDEGDGT